METIEEDNLKKTIVCNKGNMLLESYNYNENNKINKAYTLKYNFNNLDPNKVNIKALLSTGIYELLEKINPDLIEKIYILKELNINETDICILLKSIAKEIGIKQKYMLFRTKRVINYLNGSIVFYNKDISKINENIYNNYLSQLNLDNNKYDQMIFKFGKTSIMLNNLEANELIKLDNYENFNNIININFILDFDLSIKDDLPIYMENLIGLMFKKIFYNLKQFIDKLNN